MKKGFTLAEILITLGIVGVVAVLTIPTVMRGYKNRVYVSQLEKVYSQISGATQAIMSDEHVDDFYETTAGRANACNAATGECTAGIGYFLTHYFKVERDNCKDSADRCVRTDNNTYKTIEGTSVAGFSGNYCIQTVNGAAICGFYNANNHCMSIAVDVNGLEGPNIAGRDIFSLDIHKNGTISDYNSSCADDRFGCTAAQCTTGDRGSVYDAACGCLTNVIEAGWKMEY